MADSKDRENTFGLESYPMITSSDDYVEVIDAMAKDIDGVDGKVKTRPQWSSELEYILTILGFSVGLGNVWRFPYICSRNGGGAFLIPFFICLVLCGLPLVFLEVSIGQFSAKSPAHIWCLCPLMKGIGVGMLITCLGLSIYYILVCAWSLYYTVFSCRTTLLWSSCNNTWNSDDCIVGVKQLHQGLSSTSDNVTSMVYNGSMNTLMKYSTPHYEDLWKNTTLSHTAAEEFWQYKALGISDGIHDIGHIKWEIALCLFASWVLIGACTIKGVKSVGKVVYVTATLPYLVLLVMLVRGLTLPGGTDGALFYITPDFNKLLEIQVWIEACLQVFYSVGPGWGGMITIASYNKFNTNCLRNAFICTFVGESTSIFAGLVVFSILGFMAHESEVPIEQIVSSGPGLAFVTYPEVLAQLPLPQIWSFIFFLMLITLALDTLIALVETVLAAIEDEYPRLLKWRALIISAYCLVCFLLGLVLTTEPGTRSNLHIDNKFTVPDRPVSCATTDI